MGTSIGLLHPGAMGAAVGALLTATVMGGARRFAHRERALAH